MPDTAPRTGWQSAQDLRRATLEWVTAASTYFPDHPGHVPAHVLDDLDAYRTLVASGPSHSGPEAWTAYLFIPAYAMAHELSEWLRDSHRCRQLPRRLQTLLEDFRTADVAWHQAPLGRAD